MKKIPFSDCICHTKVASHSEIKDNILIEIDKTDTYQPKATDGLSFSKIDWAEATSPDRPWVQIFLPVFNELIGKITKELGYSGYEIMGIWFQQYLEGDSHCWHTHDGHFTGVYYLEYPQGCGKTRVRSPYDNKEIEVEAEEGDLIVFPSHWIHQGMTNLTNRKTIISYNFEIRCPSRL